MSGQLKHRLREGATEPLLRALEDWIEQIAANNYHASYRQDVEDRLSDLLGEVLAAAKGLPR